MPGTKSMYDKITPYIRDVIYIIGIGVATYGWISAKGENKAILETTVKYNTEALIKVEEFVTKQVDLNNKQAEVNGILMEFKTSHVK
jgi:hypothetical protein